MAGDAIDPLPGQAFSPWNISYLNKVFQEPLSYSNIDKFVSYESGGNPWCEVFTLFMEEYSGWAASTQTGAINNIMTNDVNVKDGMMSALVLNISGTYSMTLEEQQRQSGAGSNPFGRSSMTRKQSYLNYCINMLKAYVAIYGNTETNTTGLLNVNPVSVWTDPSIKDIFNSASATKGSQAYMLLARELNKFLTMADNKWDHITIVMSPEALNYLRSMPYSDVYDPTAAMKIFMKNYGAGEGPKGGYPTIDFISEPLLKAGSEFNPGATDYTMFLAPNVGAGPDNKKQDTYFFAAPLQKFVYPSIPGMYNTQYKTLARLAGIFAPVPAGILVYQGMGVD
jgi:hypothetical protein